MGKPGSIIAPDLGRLDGRFARFRRYQVMYRSDEDSSWVEYLHGPDETFLVNVAHIVEVDFITACVKPYGVKFDGVADKNVTRLITSTETHYLVSLSVDDVFRVLAGRGQDPLPLTEVGE